MISTAYIFMNCHSGAEERIIQEIADLSEVKEVRGIYGIYDIFVKVESITNESLNDIIKFRIRMKPDVTSAMALFVNRMQPGKG